VRTHLAVLALALALGLTACGDDDEPISSGGAKEEPESSAPASSETAVVPEGPAVCELAEEADVEAAFEEDLPPGSFSSGSTDEDGVQWQSDNCNWEIEDGTEVSLEVSTAEDFTDGQLQCPELDSFDVASTPVEGLDAEASWVNDKIDPTEGTLRLCTDTYLLGIDLESPDGSRDPATMQAQAVAFAEVVLSNLG
jgi:hypothetical protein